ncbi:citrate/2-methylcitrate synthase [Metabacillus iocasae]|uniref:citrate synthase (unknown stereospecificity) n=1 Tax=Priestia iocasae TaxID=2291674 RepID=A0ABS2QS71_9BACI|nr:citrate synthase [Metabacillus iocasae]
MVVTKQPSGKDSVSSNSHHHSDLEVLMAETLHIDINDIHDNLEYRSIREWDSLGHVTLLLTLEEEYNIEIEKSVRDQLISVAAIKKYIHQQLTPALNGNKQEGSDSTVDQNQHDHGSTPKVSRGLAGVTFDTTRTTMIDGQKGRLLYRGISIHELVQHSTFEETAFLLVEGRLPTKDELHTFITELHNHMTLPEVIQQMIHALKDAHPMQMLRTVISALGACHEDQSLGVKKGSRTTAISIMAQVPVVIATHLACRSGRKRMVPRSELSYAANLLYLLVGRIPTSKEEEIMNKILILHADHGSNASAFAARVAASTEADVYAALTAAVSTFHGNLHGGAIEKVMSMIKSIENPENASRFVEENHAKGKPIMGFGHRVYQTEDPRATHLRDIARDLSKGHGYYEILEALVSAMKPYIDKGVDVNVDFYASVIYDLLGIPQDYFIAVFALGRIPGWLSQVNEQYENNILIRPLLQYVGETEVPYLPLNERM